MKQGIVIGAYWGNAEALDLLMSSLAGVNWPVYVVISGLADSPHDWLKEVMFACELQGWKMLANSEDAFELGAFQKILDVTDLDEFLFFQDTFEVIDQSFIDDVMLSPNSVALGPDFFHYAGKWKRSVLETMDIPVVRSKGQSIHQEHTFSRAYREKDVVEVFDPNFHDLAHKGFEERFGRMNMLLENQWFRKRKADWGQRIVQ